MQARNAIVIYSRTASGRIPVTLNRRTNLFFRQSIMVRHVASYLGPSVLETALTSMKEKYREFYVWHLENNTYVFRKIPYFGYMYSQTIERTTWDKQSMEICFKNIEQIDASKNAIPVLPSNPKKIYKIGYYELSLFVSVTNTNIIDKRSIMQFIHHINDELEKRCIGVLLYSEFIIIESKINFVTSLLRYNLSISSML